MNAQDAIAVLHLFQVNMADQDIQCDAEGYSTNREYMVGGHVNTTIVNV